MPWRRLAGEALVLGVLLCWLVALVLGAIGAPERPAADAPPALAASGDAPVVLVGVPGLTWDLVDAGSTPILDRMAREGASAALVVRGTHEVTCAEDAWLTLGAGQRAATDLPGCGDAGGETGGGGTAYPGGVDEVLGEGGVDPAAWQRWQQAAARRALDPRLGTLAELSERSGECVVAHGPGAALAAAGPDGGVARLAPSPLDPSGPDGGVAGAPDPAGPDDGVAGAADPLSLDGGCRLHLVSAPPVNTGDTPGLLPTIDTALARLVSDLPPGSRLVVAGMGHTAGGAEPTVLTSVLVGEEPAPRSLASDSTRQVGLVQLTDLTVGLLEAVSAGTDGALAGGSLRTVGADDPSASASRLAEGAGWAKRAAPAALVSLALLVVPLLGGAVLLRRHRAVAVVATAAMAVPVATFLASLLPWWSTGRPVAAVVLAVLGWASLVAALAWTGPWRAAALGPPAVVAALTLAVIGADLLLSSRLGLVSVLGLQPVTAGRFYGQGNVGFGMVLGAYLVVAASLLGRPEARRARTAAAVGVLGAATVLLNAAPGAGADFGGVPAFVVATGLLVLAALRVPWRLSSLALLGLAGLAVAAAVMVADWARGPQQRTHLGGFVQSVLDGTAGPVVGRKLAQSLGILVSYPASWLAVLALVLVAVVVLRPPDWTAPLWREPGLRPALLAGLVAMVLTWALNDSGVAAVGATLTFLIAASVVVLARRSPRRSSRR